MSTPSYFGTDGVRGQANTAPITADLALKLAYAAGQVFRNRVRHSERPAVVIGKDTRLSGYMLEGALQAGFTAMGFHVLRVGPLPTPAVSMLTRSLRADVGVMITASHNPYSDNGIKLFDATGTKIAPDVVAEIEALMHNESGIELAAPQRIGKVLQLEDAVGRYTEFCKQTVDNDLDLDGLKLVVDCANGAAYKIAPRIFWEMGAQITRIGCEPNGFNINKKCGATHTDALVEAVKREGADLGIALDGDADRLILADENGTVIDGDQIITAIALHLQRQGKLAQPGVVGTVMSNMGMEKHLEAKGLTLHRTPVGDHHVERAMREHGYNLGGESSGHIILSDHATTGDGIMAALQFLSIMDGLQIKASELARTFTPFPQKLENITIPRDFNADDFLASSAVSGKIEEVSTGLNGHGRVLIRKSGTEPLIRVMVEADTEERVNGSVSALVTHMQSELQRLGG